jgi:acetyl-CoA carboxylase beta subunit
MDSLKYKKKFTKISHLTEDERHERLKAQKRAWAIRNKKSLKYFNKNYLKIHQIKFVNVMSELLQKNIKKKMTRTNIKKDIAYLNGLLNKIVMKLNDMNNNFLE